MIELTPLDVRKKRGDFRRAMRGFDPGEVDAFLELVAERMESLVKENLTLKERAARLQDQVREQGDREKAVQDALVTAQELRKDISGQAQREAELIKREAEAEIERMLLDAEHRAEELRSSAVELERRRRRFLRAYHQYLVRELDEVDRESARHPLEEPPLELELDGRVADAETAVPPLGRVGGDAPEEGPADASIELETASGDDSAGSGLIEEPVGEDAADLDANADGDVDVDLDDELIEEPATNAEAAADSVPAEDGEAVSVESLAPAPTMSEDETDAEWPGAARMRTEVGSDRTGDPDGL